jgi:hypothetical protein
MVRLVGSGAKPAQRWILFERNDMAESDNILTKLQDLWLYDNATGPHVVRLAFVLARCS